jgi:hypothetical protein
VNEGGIPLPPQPSCGGLKKGNDKISAKNQPEPTLRRNNKQINMRKKKKDKR